MSSQRHLKLIKLVTFGGHNDISLMVKRLASRDPGLLSNSHSDDQARPDSAVGE